MKLLGKKDSTQIFKLDKIPGIGKKIQERLKEFYLTEENALNAIKVGAAGCVPGISYKQALKFSQYYFQTHENIVKEDILVTQDIRDIYSNIIDIISDYTHTDYSKYKGSDETLSIVDEICTKKLKKAYPDQTVNEILNWGINSDIARIPVVSADDETKLIGVIRRESFLKAWKMAYTKGERSIL